jgi:hypothetical protein
MYADDRRVDHVHGGVMSPSQCVHNPAPDAGPPPANEPIVAGGVGAEAVSRLPTSSSRAIIAPSYCRGDRHAVTASNDKEGQHASSDASDICRACDLSRVSFGKSARRYKTSHPGNSKVGSCAAISGRCSGPERSRRCQTFFFHSLRGGIGYTVQGGDTPHPRSTRHFLIP